MYIVVLTIRSYVAHAIQHAPVFEAAGYHVPVHSLAERLLSHIRRYELVHAGDRIGVAVSGGIDSVALLRLLLELRLELGIVLSVVHFNHKLRGAESDADEEFVARLAHEFDLEFYADSDDVAQEAQREHISVEAAAREMRYGFFRYLLGEDCESEPQGLKPRLSSTPSGAAGSRALSKHVRAPVDRLRAPLNKIATGHTLDDQAETVLLRLIRGTGFKGLGGIYPRISVQDEAGELCGEIVRPLLETRRRELEQYLREIKQAWRDDSTNASDQYTRNRLRRSVVPLLEREFNPAVAGNLAELSEIARAEDDYWENEIAGWMGTVVHWSQPDWAPRTGNPLVRIQGAGSAEGESLTPSAMDAVISRVWLLSEPLAVQRRLLKAVGDEAGIPLEFRHIEEILQFAAEGASRKEIDLPRGWKLRGEPDTLLFAAPDPRAADREHDEADKRGYAYTLPVPGRVNVPELGVVVEALVITPQAQGSGYNPQHLLDPELLHPPLTVRNWHPGERFWPAHTKAPKKIKELLQERHVAQPERRLWPVITDGEEIIWLRGCTPSARLTAKAGRDGVLIREMPVSENSEGRGPGENR